jgi:hypothetical protein
MVRVYRTESLRSNTLKHVDRSELICFHSPVREGKPGENGRPTEETIRLALR